MKPTVIAVVGTKKSGKTTTIENLIRELTYRGYKVASIKHVPEENHTIDTPGKDTWRYAQAGARTIVSAANNEIATIEKVQLKTVSLDQLIEKCKGNDVVFMEGLKKLIAKRNSVAKIAVVKTSDEAVNALKTYKPIVGFSGPYPAKDINPTIPYANGVENSKELADIIENRLLKRRRFGKA